MRNPDVIHSGTNIYRLNDRYPLAGVAQGATLFPAAFQGFRQQVQGLEEPPVELLSLQAHPGLELEFFMYTGVNEVEGKFGCSS